MSNQHTSKKSLTLNILILLSCIAMLIVATYAWFTDSASTGASKIQSGKLKVQILNADGEEIKDNTLQWIKAKGAAENETVLWEPNATYELEPFMIKNTGNLALDYKISVTTIGKDQKLLDALEFTISGIDGLSYENLSDFSSQLLPESTTGLITLSAHMKQTAGNEFQDLMLESVKIEVSATQSSYEYDSYSNLYDLDSDQNPSYINSNTSNISEILGSGGYIVLTTDAANPGSVLITQDTTINLAGNTLNVGYIQVTDGADLTVKNGTLVYTKNADKFYITQSSDQPDSAIAFENVAFKNTGSETSTYQAVQYYQSIDTENTTFSFKDCTFENMYVSFSGNYRFTTSVVNAVFENCTFNNTGQNSAIDYSIPKATGSVTVRNCSFDLTSVNTAVYAVSNMNLKSSIIFEGSNRVKGIATSSGTVKVYFYDNNVAGSNTITVNGDATLS